MPNNPSTPMTDDELVDRIIQQMEAGVVPWRKPWSETAPVVVGSMQYSGAMWPSNLRAPRVPYGIFNGMILLTIAKEREYRTNLWIAKEVAEELGTLAEGDASPVALRRYDDDYTTDGKPPRYVYNVEQVDDCERTLGFSFLEEPPTNADSKYRDARRLRDRLEKNLSLRIVTGRKAAYSPKEDIVMMPPIERFHDVDGDGVARYWSTLWHEVIHWTGHPTRLDRRRHERWGDEIYAFEELIAELGAAFLCAKLRIEGNLQHENYLTSWCRVIRRGRFGVLWNASEKATDAKDFILKGKNPDQD